MFSVHVIDAEKNLRVVEIKASHAIIGKDRECHIRLEGWRVGKEHARIFRTTSGLYIQDYGSFHGTQVNGVRISQHGPLSYSDNITIGTYNINIVDAGDPKFVDEKTVSAKDDALPKTSLQAPTSFAKAAPAANTGARPNLATTHHLWRTRIHEQLLETIDLRRRDISRMEDQELRVETEILIREIVERENLAATLNNNNNITGSKEDRRSTLRKVTTLDQEKLIKDVLSEAVGLGPLEELLADESITEIMVNRHDEIYLERGGRLVRHYDTFTSERAVLGVIERIVAPLGRRIDESSPMVDARLKDGSRVNAIIPPLSLKGATLTIRKFSNKVLSAENLVSYGSLSEAMARFMEVCVIHRKNVIISGGTGSGKTTLLNVLSNFIPHEERIITIEDAAELRLTHTNLVNLEARPSNAEGRGQVAIRDLVKNALRMRPDRIVIGECRGGEALDMLQAMNTGHEGSLTTLHANTARDALARLETLILMSGMDLPIQAIREQISSAVDIIIQQARLADGQRIVTGVTEVTGMESGKIQLQELFRFEPTGRNEEGRIQGKFMGCDMTPTFYEELREAGVDLDISIFGRKAVAAGSKNASATVVSEFGLSE